MFNGISIDGGEYQARELVCSMQSLTSWGEEMTTVLISTSQWLGNYAAEIQHGSHPQAEYLIEDEEDEEVDDDDDDDGGEEGDDGFDDYQPRTRPASQAAIDGLEKVEIDESLGGGGRPCTVCLEEMAIGTTEARRLPCSHVYHAACIVEWLKKSNMCPLCRHKLPVVDFDLNVKLPVIDFDLNLDDVSCINYSLNQ